ncbi:MAG TPA: tetratricopeptide repeat protein [Chitinophagaceae bacterium]|nr:tetratricopeptide repeat protein [Chitinophagaceae bacterium]
MENDTNTNTPFHEQRKLGAVMFADMTGYTAMMQEDEAHAKLLRQRQRQTLDSLIPAHHGTILQYFGDGTLSIFDSATDAVRCGIAIQNELQKEPAVKLRIGIHIGDIVYDREGIYGDCVNIASRIESLSVPGGVLFSAKVYDEIKNQRDIKAKPIGKFHLKNVKQPLEVYAATNDGLVIPLPAEIHGKTVEPSSLSSLFKKRSVRLITVLAAAMIIMLTVALLVLLPGKNTNINSIAVLPLENLSGDSSQEYFVSGMHETLISELSKISALKVISRTSTIQYKNQKIPLRQIAKELGVAALLEGSVIRDGDLVRISVKLINGRTDENIWSQDFDRKLQNILALYSEVAKKIAGEIKISLTPQDQERLVSISLVNAQAYEYYLIGRHYWNQRTIQSYKLAIDSYKRALDLDSSYALAYAALADCYILLGEQGGMSQIEAGSLAKELIDKALKLNANLAEAHASNGTWKLGFEWNWTEAEEEFKKAIALNPGLAITYQWYGRMLGFIGRFDEALVQLAKAKELDPLSPVIVAYTSQVYIYSKQYKKSEEVLQQALNLHPNHALILHNIGELYIAQGRYGEAIAPLKKSAEESASAHYKAMLALAYARANQRQEATRILNELLNSADQRSVSGFNIGCIYLALGNKEQALRQLEYGYEQRDVWIKELKAWPWFDELKNEPRYKDLMRKLNFPQDVGGVKQ